MPLKMDKRTTDKYGQLPIYFIPNKGQLTDNRIHYYAQSAGCGGFFTKEGASFVFREKVSTSKEDKEGQGFRLDFRLLHANQGVKPVIRGEIPGTVNYFKGKNPEKGHTNISMFQEVVYPKIWPGIDLVFRGEQGQIKYEFVLQPGAKVEDIRFTYEGAEELSLDEDGNLLIATPFGMVMDTLPVSYQMKDGRYHNVESAFRLTVNDKGEAGVTFSVGKGYDSRYPLIIDPGLVYSTYLGGNDSDQGNSIAVDNAGNAYVVGTTFSANFPTTTGAFQTSNNGFGDVFVTKFDPSGTALVYSTYLGGTTSFDQGWDVAVDNAGNAYVTGVTFSTDFPTTPGAFQSMPQGFIDAFVTKLNSTGTALVYSTYLGGTGFDQGSGIAVDNAGNAYITGYTAFSNFPVTPGAFQMTSNGNGDAFVTKLNPTGTALVYSTYLGGTELDQGLGIAVDNAGNAYVTGDTLSANFPTTPGAFQTTFNAFTDAFVTKLNPMGTQLVYSTYLGGSDYDSTTGIIVDNVGNAYVTGYTSSTDFPTTPGAFDTTYKGDGDAFVTKLNPTGSKLVYSTYLGGTDLDQGLGIAVDNAGNVYVTGATQSADFPTTTCAFDTTFNGVIDAFVTKLNPAGTALLYSTYLGGSDFNQGYAIAVDNAHNAYVTGLTMSTDFPTSPNAFDTTFNGVQDAFVTKFNIPPAQPFYLGVSLTKDVQVQSDATLSVQGHFCEPRIPHQTTDLSLQKENDIGCIRAKRVHDWVVFGTEHQQKGFIPVGLTSQILDCQNVNSTITVLCEAIPGSSSFSILDDTKLTHEIPEAHLVMIRFTVLVRLQYFCNGTPLCDFEVPVTTVDRVILCYPEGTSIVAKVSAVECLVVGENC